MKEIQENKKGLKKEGADLNFFKNSITLNEMASILKAGMPNDIISEGYRGVMDLQKNSLDLINNLQNKSILDSYQVNKIESAFLSPVSGAIVDIGLNTISGNRLLNEDVIKESDFAVLQNLSSISLDTIKDQQDLFLSNLGDSKISGRSVINSAPSASMVMTGIDTMMRAIPTFPLDINSPTLDLIRDQNFLTQKEIEKQEDGLDLILGKLGSGLVETRKGCWETFYRKGPDYIRQSSSSMRGLVDTLLRIIAPKEMVKETQYFKESPEARDMNGSPTRKAKIYYAVNYDIKRTERLQRLAKGLLESYANLNAWDHEPINNDEFARGILITIEGYIISLLSEKREEV